jgi:hypothetical protein
MNFLSHHEIARRLNGERDRGYLFGTMAPDFFGMFRVQRSNTASASISAGLALHQPTDNAFDELAPIKELRASMAASFKEFMPRWTAVQCSRVGKDILFDGIHLSQKPVLLAYGRTMLFAASGNAGIADMAQPTQQWMDRLRMLEEVGIPRYDDPLVVADSLQRRLRGTRTEFDVSFIPELGASLAQHQVVVNEIGQAVVESVVERLSIQKHLL